MNPLKRRLASESLLERTLWMWVLSFSLFFLAWAVSYLLLPQGILRGRLPGTALFGEDVDVFSTFLKIFFFNFLMGGIAFSLCNLVKVGKIPLGIVPIWLEMILFGLLKGTDSFIYPYASMLASFIGFLRTGLWESTALILMTCSTSNIVMYQQESWKSGRLTKIRQRKDLKLTRSEKGTYLIGVMIILISALTESLAIFGIIP